MLWNEQLHIVLDIDIIASSLIIGIPVRWLSADLRSIQCRSSSDDVKAKRF